MKSLINVIKKLEESEGIARITANLEFANEIKQMIGELRQGKLTLPFNNEEGNDPVDWPILSLVENGTPTDNVTGEDLNIDLEQLKNN